MITFFWHRRDLRIEDNIGLYQSLSQKSTTYRVQPIFIFDPDILDRLKDKSDHRLTLIHKWLEELRQEYQTLGCDLWLFYGKPVDVFKQLLEQHNISAVYTNIDYEPFAIQRDLVVEKLLSAKRVQFKSFKDQVIFEKFEVLNSEAKPYTVFTAYKNKWLQQFKQLNIQPVDVKKLKKNFNAKTQHNAHWLELDLIGFFKNTTIMLPKFDIDADLIKHYAEQRDFPALDQTTHVGAALRFGRLSIRKLVLLASQTSDVWLSELIWREFFMQILFHFPRVIRQSYRPQFDKVKWRKNKADFEKWKIGQTGYPIVDAGMRELNQTGHMHNRVRMIVGSFLTKHLLIHWYHGERYFAEKLFDFDLAANNGNWQWVAGSGCDAAPYFRIFNPQAQTKKFDAKHEYIKKWVPEYMSASYPQPMIDHSLARDRALRAFAAVSKKV